MVKSGYETANVSKQNTGLPYDLWIDSIGKDRKAKYNVPKLKVDVNRELVLVSISENPEVLINKEKFPNFLLSDTILYLVWMCF